MKMKYHKIIFLLDSEVRCFYWDSTLHLLIGFALNRIVGQNSDILLDHLTCALLSKEDYTELALNRLIFILCIVRKCT